VEVLDLAAVVVEASFFEMVEDLAKEFLRQVQYVGHCRLISARDVVELEVYGEDGGQTTCAEGQRVIGCNTWMAKYMRIHYVSTRR